MVRLSGPTAYLEICPKFEVIISPYARIVSEKSILEQNSISGIDSLTLTLYPTDYV